MIKIKVKKIFWSEGGCRGKMFLFLPIGEKDYLASSLINEDIEVLGEKLLPTWGWALGKYPEYRYISREVKGGNWEEVRKKIDELEKESINALYKAIDRYKSLEAEKPQDEEYEIVLR